MNKSESLLTKIHRHLFMSINYYRMMYWILKIYSGFNYTIQNCRKLGMTIWKKDSLQIIFNLKNKLTRIYGGPWLQTYFEMLTSSTENL